MTKKIISLTFCLVSCAMVFAQRLDDNAISFKLSPQHVVIGGIKFLVEAPVFESNFRFSLEPIFYSITNQSHEAINPIPSGYSNVSPSENFSGFGIDGIFKNHFPNNGNNINAYVGIGGGFHNINKKYEEYNYRSTMEDGLEVFRYAKGKESETITRTDIITVIGFNIFGNSYLCMDVAAGVNYQFTDFNSTLTNSFNNEQYLYQKSGFTYRLTVSFGIYFPTKQPLFHEVLK